MNKKVVPSMAVLFVLLTFSFVASVNASTTAWTRVYRRENSEAAFAMIPTSDGGYALVGYSMEGGVKVLLIKTDAQGNMEWSKTYGTQSTSAYSLAETLDGGYVITGYTIQTDTAEWDAFLIKTDSEGNLEWNKTYKGPEEDAAQAVVATKDGGYAMVGVRNILSPGGGDLWLITTDSSGNMLLNITYHNTGRYATKSLVTTQDGGLAIAGTIMDLAMEEVDFSLIKIDKFGNIELNKTYGGALREGAASLVATPDGGYAIAGSTGDSFENTDFWLVKTDASGNMEWNRTYGGTENEQARSLVATSDGGYAILGQKGEVASGGDFWLVKTNSTGHMEWNQTHIETGDDLVSALAEAPDGGYVFAGAWKAFSSESDFCLIKTNECVNRHEFYFHWGYYTYSILVWSNSTLGDFNFGLYQNQISFSVTGPTGTTGFCQIIIPAEIVGEDLPIYMNEVELVEEVDYTRTYNGTHIIFDFNYNHSTHTIEITGTTPITTIPEYTSWLIPTLLLGATTFSVVNKKVRTGSKKREPER